MRTRQPFSQELIASEHDSDMLCYSGDLDLNLMTLIHKIGLDVQKTYLPTENEVSKSRLSKVKAQDRQTDITEHITMLHF